DRPLPVAALLGSRFHSIGPRAPHSATPFRQASQTSFLGRLGNHKSPASTCSRRLSELPWDALAPKIPRCRGEKSTGEAPPVPAALRDPRCLLLKVSRFRAHQRLLKSQSVTA